MPHNKISVNSTRHLLQDASGSSASRIDLWVEFVKAAGVNDMVEVGVYRGAFAEKILKNCPSIGKYYMVDPWRNLDSWNKPANVSSEQFNEFFEETKSRTEFAAEKRIILRGKTGEVLDAIPDGSLDFAYIDADHTLKGITIDLHRIYPKVRRGGWIGGDDFSETIWQHDNCFEPTLVFPFAVYFAEAVDSPIFGLPHRQFLIHKDESESFSFVDFTGKYTCDDLHSQFVQAGTLNDLAKKRAGRVRRMARKLSRRFMTSFRVKL